MLKRHSMWRNIPIRRPHLVRWRMQQPIPSCSLLSRPGPISPRVSKFQLVWNGTFRREVEHSSLPLRPPVNGINFVVWNLGEEIAVEIGICIADQSKLCTSPPSRPCQRRSIQKGKLGASEELAGFTSCSRFETRVVTLKYGSRIKGYLILPVRLYKKGFTNLIYSWFP